MCNFSQIEVNSIREAVAGHQLMSVKLASYANACTDANIKKMFNTASGDAKNAANNLLQML